MFGSFNAIAKLSDSSLDLWAEAMRALPDSELTLKAMTLNDNADRNLLFARLAARGIDAGRLHVLKPVDKFTDHLDLYGDIDIALDTHPFTGGTTTADALWMGAPVLTLAGDRMVSRMSTSMLMSVGMPDWIADTRADFVAKAVAFARAPDLRADLRARQRGMARRSALFDGRDLARAVGEAFRGMWQATIKP